MLSNVSWQTYWTFVAAATLAYYAIVYLVYFRKTYKLHYQQPLPDIAPSTDAKDQPTLFEPETPRAKGPLPKDEESIAYACMDELNAFFENQKNRMPIRSELTLSLHTILQKYPSLRSSEYKDSLTNVIATQCENTCSIHLSADELKYVWFG